MLACGFAVGVAALAAEPATQPGPPVERSVRVSGPAVAFASPLRTPEQVRPELGADPRSEPFVAYWRDRLTRSPARLLDAWLSRPEPWADQLLPILEAYSVPPEFLYLALLESGMRAEATSSAEAAGIWQFTEETALQYGLAVGDEADERRDELLATEAAGRYLRDLYRQFGSWELAAAAYNAGPARVERALARTGADGYWDLVEVGHLPAETRAYVPRFLAIVELAAERSVPRRPLARAGSVLSAD